MLSVIAAPLRVGGSVQEHALAFLARVKIHGATAASASTQNTALHQIFFWGNASRLSISSYSRHSGPLR